MQRTVSLMPAALVAVLLQACAVPPDGPGLPADRIDASATLEPTRGSTASGTANFREQGDDVIVTVDLDGLPPNSVHGFHVHEKGDCSGDGMAAGGHFNPMRTPHGPPSGAHHAGDMPSLTADANGAVRTTFRLHEVVLGAGGGALDMVGRGLIVHAQPDDYTTQPTGNSGDRIACGVIVRR